MSKITKEFSMSVKERRYRQFSEAFKQEKVREINEGRSRVADICRAYQVSYNSIYNWINRYSNISKPERTIVETKSDTTKILALQKKIADLERLLGQKQVQLDFQNKMIEIAEETYQVDIKKKFETKP